MTRVLALTAAALFLAPKPEVHRAAVPLPLLPSVARVHLDVSRDHVVIVEDVDVPRGEWRTGDLDLFVAFGAPGVPEALDARLFPVPDGGLDPDEHEGGASIPVERAPFRPATANVLLGPPQMAGVLLHIDAASFRRATDPGGMATLRIRSLLPLPIEDAQGGHEVLVRLGAQASMPLTLGRIQLAGPEGPPSSTRVEARLCGPDADPWPLAVAVSPRPLTRVGPLAPIAPVLAVRHASDDLCVRFWTSG